MKKFFKFLLGLAAVAATVGGILYFVKNLLLKDYLDDYDDDFDNDLYEEDNDERDYVTITPDASKSADSDDVETADEVEDEPDELVD